MSLPWGDLMRAALHAGLSPAEFWNLSFREWRWLTAGEQALGRQRLASLMTAYPDSGESKVCHDTEQ